MCHALSHLFLVDKNIKLHFTGIVLISILFEKKGMTETAQIWCVAHHVISSRFWGP